jgi:hypothetical protein
MTLNVSLDREYCPPTLFETNNGTDAPTKLTALAAAVSTVTPVVVEDEDEPTGVAVNVTAPAHVPPD